MSTGITARTRRRARHAFGGVAALAAVALLVTGCVPAPDEEESVRLAGAFPELYSQTIGWQACGEDFGLTEMYEEIFQAQGTDVSSFECAMITAPMDWNHSENTKTIELAVVRIPTSGTGDKIGSLLSNPGGPGESGLDLAYGLALTPSMAPVMASYDLVGFDPRGIGRSTPLECGSESSITELNISTCVEVSPLALSMGTSQVAKDMDLLRNLMGDEALHYLGYSYGTAVGATYSTLFPERVGRMILDGPVAGDWASPIRSFDQIVAVGNGLDTMLSGCGSLYEVADCDFAEQVPLASLIQSLNTEPLVTSSGAEVSGTVLYRYLVTGLYQPVAGREVVLSTVSAALAGDQDSVDAMSTAMEGGGAFVNLSGTIVRCHSFPEDPKISEMIAHIEEVGMPEVVGGPDINDETLRMFVDLSCDAMPGSGDDFVDTFTGSDEAPILVIGITGDHATPFAGAVKLREELGNARLVTVEGVGHGASFLKNWSCIDEVATEYLVDGTLPAEDTVCAP